MTVAVGVGVAIAALTLTACASTNKSNSSGGGGNGGGSSSVDWSTQTSAAAGGGMAALVKAAKAEGQLNVITLPRDWANYGQLMDDFTAKYGIKITDANPDGSSAEELAAIKSLKSQPKAPDVVDVGQSYAFQGAAQGMFAPYKVATWNDIPDSFKDADGKWFNDYGGYMSIGCDTSKVKNCPTTIKALDNPQYKKELALNGDPTEANAAFSAVWTAALANGGSYDNIQPGIDFFAKLKSEGIYVPIQASEQTIESGETPIVLDWDYLNAAKTAALAAKGRTFSVTIPSDATFAGYYSQAISAYAPHPAAARLWEEYLYSVQGQNGWRKGGARPVEMDAMTKAGTIDQALAAKLPKVTGTAQAVTATQYTDASNTIAQKWASTVK